MASKKKDEAVPAPIALAPRLRERGLEPLYVIEGKESFLRSQALGDLRAFAAGGSGDGKSGSLAETRFDGAKGSLAQVLDELRTLPFLASFRLVHISDAEEFLAACMAECPDELDRALDEIKSFKKVALILESEGLDGRLKISKRVRDASVRVVCDTPDDAGLLRFVRERAEVRGRKFARGADSALLERFGGGAGVQVDLGILDSEIAKLCSGSEGAIGVEHVQALASSLTAEDTFAIVGAVGRGDTRGALEALRAVFRDGAVVDGERKREPKALAPMLTGLLAWDLGRLFKARAMLDAGRSAQDVLAEARAWRERDVFLARARGANPESLRRMHLLLREADAQLKDSGDPFEILTTLIARLSLAAPAARTGRPAYAR